MVQKKSPPTAPFPKIPPQALPIRLHIENKRVAKKLALFRTFAISSPKSKGCTILHNFAQCALSFQPGIRAAIDPRARREGKLTAENVSKN